MDSGTLNIWQVIWRCVWYKWVSGRGRASREEFTIYLVFFIAFCALWIGGIFLLMAWAGDVNLIDFTLGYVPYFLAPPLFAVGVRRMHDIGRSGWWLLTVFGLFWLFSQGMAGPNRYGPEPPKVVW